MSSSFIDCMTSAAMKAARGLVRDFGEIENLQVSRKSLGNFVSTADKRAEKILIDELTRIRPEYNFISEEVGRIENSKSPFCWVIDPLDGTGNFLHGIPHFCINVALIKKNVPLAAVTYDPIKDECFWAEKGKGAFLNRRRIRVSRRNRLEECVLGIVDVPRIKKPLESLFPKTTSLRSMGSCALDLAYVAAGRFDGFIEIGCSIWDIAAGYLLVNEAGGYIKSVDENDVLQSQMLFASNPFLVKKISSLCDTHFQG